MKHPSASPVIASFAKLNLYLQVLGRRQDGFHDLSTLFARIDLADRLIFKPRKDNLIKIVCSNPAVPQNKSNLVYRAAALLKQEYKLSAGIEIEINKVIPVGAGLGGGSANAATALVELNRIWNLNLSKTQLVRLGAKLGSDIPFFIHQVKFALGTERGDKIKPLISLNKLKLHFILVYPDLKVSTPLIYREFDVFLSANRNFSGLTRAAHNVKILISGLLKKGQAFSSGYLFNSLEVITCSLYPVVKQVKKALCDMGLDKVMMSGSGPVVFAFCDSRQQAQTLCGRLRKQYKSWQFFVVSTV